MTRTVINVVSGKGGTGKTLLATVLADMLGNAPNAQTVVVDLDVFVRGLTSLLYFHREEKLRIAPKDRLSVAQLFVGKGVEVRINSGNLAIAKYRSFDVVPAVSTINEILNFQDIVPNSRQEAKGLVQKILQLIPDSYRFVILDSRAGYDELIAATHELSDVSVCVEEQDPISRITSDNLVAQLRSNSNVPLFRLTNKARGVTTPEQLEDISRGVTELGLIPFDMDVLTSFGAPDFWDEISASLYRSALARVWNRLSAKMDLGVELSPPRVSPVGSESLESRVGVFSWRERVFFIYGLLIAITGLAYGLYGKEMIYALQNDPMRAMSLALGLMGLLTSFWVVLRRR